MKWRFLNTGANTGKFNMAFDLLLTKIIRPGEAFFRLYTWTPYCISLGANQNINSVNKGKAASDGIDIVTRPTGGRAILHSEEITYSVVLPVENNISARKIYNDINVALKSGLELFSPALNEIELEGKQPDFQSFYKEEKSAVCFAVPAKSELKYKGKKLVGSAQRKIGSVILQHGSILTGGYHKKIIDYLNLSASVFHELKLEIENTTVELNSILDNDINYDLLADSLLKGFEKQFGDDFEPTDSGFILGSAAAADIF